MNFLILLINKRVIQHTFCTQRIIHIISIGIENKNLNSSPLNKNCFGGKHCSLWTKQHISALSLWLTIKCDPILVVSCFPTIPHRPAPIHTHTHTHASPSTPVPAPPPPDCNNPLASDWLPFKSDDWSVTGHVGLWTGLTWWGRSDVWEIRHLFWFVWNVCRRQTQQKFPQQPRHPASSQSTQ